MRQYIRETLGNGVKICAAPRTGVESVSIIVVIKSGSDWEDARVAGISHLFEHLCFRGTRTYQSSKAISRILDTMGPHDNASTGREDIQFFKKASASNALQVIDVLFEMVAYPLLRASDIAIEKGPVQEEMKTALSLPFGIRDVLLSQTLYGEQSAGRDVAGTLESVRSISPEDLQNFHRQICVGPNIAVVLVGKIEERVLTAVKEKFSHIPNGTRPAKGKTIEELAGPVCKLEYHNAKQMFLSFAVKTFDYYNENVPALAVMKTSLGGMASSLLFEEVRSERGLVYHIHGENEFYSDRGHFEISLEVSPENLETVVSLVLDLLSKSYAIHEKYIDRAKNNMIEDVDLHFEDSLACAGFFADREAYELPFMTPNKLKDKIAAVSHDDVRAVASRIFRPERLYVVGVGPIRSKQRLLRAQEIVKNSFQ